MTERIIAINPAALGLLAARQQELQGCEWPLAFAPTCEQAVRTAITQAVDSRAAVAVAARGRHGDAPVIATVSGFNASAHPYVLMRLVSARDGHAVPTALRSTVLEQIDSLASAFVMADRELRIEYWNAAFARLVGNPGPQGIAGQSLLRWLNLTTDDLERMRRQTELREAAIVMTTTLSVGHVYAMPIQVTAVSVPEATSGHWAFIVRGVD